MRCAHIGRLCLALTLAPGVSAAAQTPQPTPAPQTAPAAKPAQPPAGRARQSPPASPRLSLTVMVTALDGKTLPEVVVRAAGPVDREAPTDPSGLVTFANMAPGTYRLRFEHPGFITFEKEVTMGVGKPMRASAALSAAPPPPVPPQVESPAPPPVTPPAPAGNYQPHVVSFESWIDSSFIGRAPSRRLAAGCTASASSTLVQTNEPIPERSRPDADETIYIVAGEGTLRMGSREHSLSAGWLVTIPRGTAHAITRRGSRPLMFVSTLSGPPCQLGQ
jgi:mannose-6-phosphate isomerase-like protein (cupin superfamily)